MQKSISRTLLGLSVCVPLLIGALLLGGTLDYKSQFLNFIPQLSYASPCGAGSPPLRVFMYDLPPRFNVGLMDPNFSDAAPVTARNIPAWRWNDGLRRQHSVEYWMMASLLYDGDGESESTTEAVRVMDPDLADVFFVPFFSSLSFNVHVRNMAEIDTVDEKLQSFDLKTNMVLWGAFGSPYLFDCLVVARFANLAVFCNQLEMVNILRESDYWKRSDGRDHVIPMHHPNAFRHYRDLLNASIFIVADFGRIMNISTLTKDVVAPYPHMVESYSSEDHQDPYKSRETLLFFRGRTHRKDEGIIRAQLYKALKGTKDVIYEEAHASEEGFKAVSLMAFTFVPHDSSHIT
ncbi:hypothetical protein SASPL_115928 [Salvia splendens]|uniref:Exostosin GT47 domain-containing protein n=1 Tax=Salvia splendens TaxID=180675 RepID=A0A8X8Y394_SALSN|nr:hypothetical protein SASPL_115928 [Salvia splendens]